MRWGEHKKLDWAICGFIVGLVAGLLLGRFI